MKVKNVPGGTESKKKKLLELASKVGSHTQDIEILHSKYWYYLKMRVILRLVSTAWLLRLASTGVMMAAAHPPPTRPKLTSPLVLVLDDTGVVPI